MCSGATHILSRIKLAWFVFRHPEWKCKPWCLTCEYYDNCLFEYEMEVEETIDGIPLEWEDGSIYPNVLPTAEFPLSKDK